MATIDRQINGGALERWTNEGTAGYYTGSPLTKKRDLNATETAELAAIDTANVQVTNRAAISAGVRGDIDTCRAGIDALNVVLAKTNANLGPADTKEIARQVKVALRAVIRLARKVEEQFDSADVGAA